MESFSKPEAINSAFKSFFDEAMQVNAQLEIENKKLKRQIYTLESKLITIKIALESVE